VLGWDFMRTMAIAPPTTGESPLREEENHPPQVTDKFLHAILEHLGRECVSNGYSARLTRTTTSNLKIVEIILSDNRKLCIGAKRGNRAGVVNIASFEIVKGECCAATHALAALLEARIAEICQEYSEGTPGAPPVGATAAAAASAAAASAAVATTATAEASVVSAASASVSSAQT
jgi:hypothetical protein